MAPRKLVFEADQARALGELAFEVGVNKVPALLRFG